MSDKIYSLRTIGETRMRPRGFDTMRAFLQDRRRDELEDGYQLPADGDVSDDEPVTATVSASEVSPGEFIARWIAECEHPLYRGRDRGDEPCGRALVVEPDDPVFYCPSACAHAGTVAGGRWRRVVFPDERELVEAVLLMRHPADRHTLPGETAIMLGMENAAHGDPTPSAVRE